MSLQPCSGFLELASGFRKFLTGNTDFLTGLCPCSSGIPALLSAHFSLTFLCHLARFAYCWKGNDFQCWGGQELDGGSSKFCWQARGWVGTCLQIILGVSHHESSFLPMTVDLECDCNWAVIRMLNWPDFCGLWKVLRGDRVSWGGHVESWSLLSGYFGVIMHDSKQPLNIPGLHLLLNFFC